MSNAHISGLVYKQVDVFASEPLSGNGLAVFFDCGALSAAVMQSLTREMRQFESIFLQPSIEQNAFRARLFTMEEELDFAGHPVLGAACALHDRLGGMGPCRWMLELNAKTVSVTTMRCSAGAGMYEAEMDQGNATMLPPLSAEQAVPFLEAMNLEPRDVAPGLPLQVVSTGLPYMILPIVGGLERARVAHPDLEGLLATLGAKFAYVVDVAAMEGRTWDNAGLVEDIATGSAAGPVGAYLVTHGVIAAGMRCTLQQGRFVHRPSQLHVQVNEEREGLHVYVSGRVCMVASGCFD